MLLRWRYLWPRRRRSGWRRSSRRSRRRRTRPRRRRRDALRPPLLRLPGGWYVPALERFEHPSPPRSRRDVGRRRRSCGCGRRSRLGRLRTRAGGWVAHLYAPRAARARAAPLRLILVSPCTHCARAVTSSACAPVCIVRLERFGRCRPRKVPKRWRQRPSRASVVDILAQAKLLAKKCAQLERSTQRCAGCSHARSHAIPRCPGPGTRPIRCPKQQTKNAAPPPLARFDIRARKTLL